MPVCGRAPHPVPIVDHVHLVNQFHTSDTVDTPSLRVPSVRLPDDLVPYLAMSVCLTLLLSTATVGSLISQTSV